MRPACEDCGREVQMEDVVIALFLENGWPLLCDHCGEKRLRAEDAAARASGATVASHRGRLDPFAVVRPAGDTVMIEFHGEPILACDDGPALALCALLNVGYWAGKR